MLGILLYVYVAYNSYLYVSNFYKVFFFNLLLLVFFLPLFNIKVGFSFSTNWLCDLFWQKKIYNILLYNHFNQLDYLSSLLNPTIRCMFSYSFISLVLAQEYMSKYIKTNSTKGSGLSEILTITKVYEIKTVQVFSP